MADSLSELVADVGAYTADLDMDDEDWERACAVNGLLATDQYVDRCQYWVDRAVATQTNAGQLAYGSKSYSTGDEPSRNSPSTGYFPSYNPAAMAWSVLEFYERKGDKRYLDAVDRQYNYLVNSVKRTNDGGISRREGRNELFTEVFYFVCPFFVRYGLVTERDEPIDEAVRQVKIHTERLQDGQTGLFRHIWHESPDFYPASSYWARGIGWGTAGLIDTIVTLPDGHSEVEELVSVLERTAESLIELQDKSGFWRQRVDDTRSPLEASGTLMFAYTFQRAVEEGILGDRYERSARRAMDACKDIVSPRGEVNRIAKPPASEFAPLGITSYGQGWFLLAASRFI